VSRLQPHEEILSFWFDDGELNSNQLEERITLWFEAGPAIDAEISKRFGSSIIDAAAGRLDVWKQTARGRLALILLLDQFTRHVHRGHKEAFSFDDLALFLCLSGIELELDRDLSIIGRAFFYMPMQHAEDLSIQDKGVQNFQQLLNISPTDIQPHISHFLMSARSHRNIIAQFGRFPHRNRALGRKCTLDESEYLKLGFIPFRSKA
jgi:uncharacterized protein (DUF924 family)